MPGQLRAFIGQAGSFSFGTDVGYARPFTILPTNSLRHRANAGLSFPDVLSR
jgi:hypothetical protein